MSRVDSHYKMCSWVHSALSWSVYCYSDNPTRCGRLYSLYTMQAEASSAPFTWPARRGHDLWPRYTEAFQRHTVYAEWYV